MPATAERHAPEMDVDDMNLDSTSPGKPDGDESDPREEELGGESGETSQQNVPPVRRSKKQTRRKKPKASAKSRASTPVPTSVPNPAAKAKGKGGRPTKSAPSPVPVPPARNAPLLAAIDSIITFVARFMEHPIIQGVDESDEDFSTRRQSLVSNPEFGRHNCGLLNREEFSELNGLDVQVGNMMRLHGAPADMLPHRPEMVDGSRPSFLPHTRLQFRHTPEYKRAAAPIAVPTSRPGMTPLMEPDKPPELAIPPDDYLPPRWWLMGREDWMTTMEVFRAQCQEQGTR